MTMRIAVEGYSLQESPVHLLRLSLQRMTELFSVKIGESDLTYRQFALLLAAHQRPGSTQTDLVDMTGIDRSTIGDMLDRLVKRAFIHRARSGKDQRANAVTVLPAGVAAIEAALPAAMKAEDELLAPVPGEMRGTLLMLLRRIANVPDTVSGGQHAALRAVASPPS